MYEGKADWGIIADVKRAVQIPVIGNGDVRSVEDMVRMFEETNDISSFRRHITDYPCRRCQRSDKQNS